MTPVPKLLISIGLALVVAGLIWHFGGKFIPFGRMPGDIVIEKKGFGFYFPIVSCIVLSVVLSLFFYIFRR